MNATSALRVGTSLATAVGAVIFATSLFALLTDPTTFSSYQNQFESVVTNALLPLLKATLAALVVYAVVKEIAAALGRRSTGQAAS